MAQQADLTVYDGASTPVAHVLKALGVIQQPDGSTVASWAERIATLPDEAQVRFALISRTLKSGVVETRGRLDVPVMEAVGGANAAGYTAPPKVAYVDSEEVISRKHPRSTSLSRQVALQMCRNLFGNVSTTTPAITAGVVAEAMQLGIFPS